MHLINASNVNDAFAQGMTLLAHLGQTRVSRNGPVLRLDQPVTTHYKYPTQRVLFYDQRDANPFFHLFEALWMLNGANDVTVPAYFVPRIKTYSDDGHRLHGAYGYRWHRYMQLSTVIDTLREDPDSRRCILQLWQPDLDADYTGKDVPCNVSVKVMRDNNRIHIVVFNRSNDIIYGCYGANMVQFSMLQEYIAASLGCGVGWYEQVSTDFHAYTTAHDSQKVSWKTLWPLPDAPLVNPYGNARDSVIPFGIFGPRPTNFLSDRVMFDAELYVLLEDVRKGNDPAGRGWSSPLFRYVAGPMLSAYMKYRAKDLDGALNLISQAIHDAGNIDWLLASHYWLARRRVAAEF